MGKITKSLVMLGFISLFSSCQLFGVVRDKLEKIPYQIKGEFVMEESEIYENAGFYFSFYNQSEKNIKEFTVVFYLFDEEGEPPSGARSNIVLSIETTVEGHEKLEDCISLDKYVYVVPEIPFTVDYLYVSKIMYEDGTEWTDPLGFYAMN